MMSINNNELFNILQDEYTNKSKYFSILDLDNKSNYLSHLNFADHQYRYVYRALNFIRAIDSLGIRLQRIGKLLLWPSLKGQEAAQIGAALMISADDYIFPSYREHALIYLRNINPIKLFRLLAGYTHGGWDPNAYNTHLYTLVIGAHLLHAVGYALSNKLKKNNDQSVVAFFGDGATSQGNFNEALVFASRFSVPIVFFCQNNHWAISSKWNLQSQVNIFKRAHGFGIKSIPVDGNDVLACALAVDVSIKYAKEYQKPVMIEALTYRMEGHTTSDNPLIYRNSEELEYWKTRDPIMRYKSFLDGENIGDEEFYSTIDNQVNNYIEELYNEFINEDKPDLLKWNAFKNVYSSIEHISSYDIEQLSQYLNII